MERSKQDLKQILRIIEVNPKCVEFVDEKQMAINLTDETYLFNREDFAVVSNFIKAEIRSRPNPLDRWEFWECIDADKNYNPKIKENLIKNRSKNTNARTKRILNKRSLEALCERYKIPKYLATVYLNDLITNKSQHPEQLEQVKSAKILGLI
jgi:hypothetical protein